jgi:hypothetical protein
VFAKTRDLQIDFMERTEVHFIKDHHIKEHAPLFQNTWDASSEGLYMRYNPSR